MKLLLCSATALAVGLSGGLAAPSVIDKARAARVHWDDTVAKDWPAGFRIETTPAGQQMYAYSPTSSTARPLVISLHTWSGGYDQRDKLAAYAESRGWNYVHPHVQGPNNTTDACLSDKVIDDVEDAYRWAVTNMKVDLQNIVIVGVSGGGYTALGSLLKSDIPAKAYFSWVPITDLNAWRRQSVERNPKYLADVENCAAVNGTYDAAEARRRSPLHMELEQGRRYPELHLYAGLHDGFKGSVPTSHSILFYNKMASHYHAAPETLVNAEEMAAITTLASEVDSTELVGDRDVHLKRSIPGLSLTVFEGGHEMLVSYTADAIDRATRSN